MQLVDPGAEYEPAGQVWQMRVPPDTTCRVPEEHSRQPSSPCEAALLTLPAGQSRHCVWASLAYLPAAHATQVPPLGMWPAGQGRQAERSALSTVEAGQAVQDVPWALLT